MTRNDPFLLNAAVEPNQSATQIRISPHKLAAALERQRADQIDAAASRVERQFRRYGGFDLVNAAECLLVARWFERNGHNRIARFLRINAGVRIAVAVTGSMQEPLAAKVVAGPKQQALS